MLLCCSGDPIKLHPGRRKSQISRPTNRRVATPSTWTLTYRPVAPVIWCLPSNFYVLINGVRTSRESDF